MRPPTPKDRIDKLDFFHDTLNDSQKTAVRFCLESPEVACIHGPPGAFQVLMKATIIVDFLITSNKGTGKTHTLIEIIRQLTTETPGNPKPKRVLVCGASNLSVDNILERLLALPVVDKTKRLKVTRIGHPARVMAHEGIMDSTLEVKATRTDQVFRRYYIIKYCWLRMTS